MTRAINGVEVPRYYRGQRVGTALRYDYRMAMKALDHHFSRQPPALSVHAALAMIGRDGGE